MVKGGLGERVIWSGCITLHAVHFLQSVTTSTPSSLDTAMADIDSSRGYGNMESQLLGRFKFAFVPVAWLFLPRCVWWVVVGYLDTLSDEGGGIHARV